MSEAALARGVRAASRTYGDFVASAPPDGPLGGHGGGASAEGAALDGARGLLAAEGRGGDTLLLAEQFRRFPKSGAGSLSAAEVLAILTLDRGGGSALSLSDSWKVVDKCAERDPINGKRIVDCDALCKLLATSAAVQVL